MTHNKDKVTTDEHFKHNSIVQVGLFKELSGD